MILSHVIQEEVIGFQQTWLTMSLAYYAQIRPKNRTNTCKNNSWTFYMHNMPIG